MVVHRLGSMCNLVGKGSLGGLKREFVALQSKQYCISLNKFQGIVNMPTKYHLSLQPPACVELLMSPTMAGNSAQPGSGLRNEIPGRYNSNHMRPAPVNQESST